MTDYPSTGLSPERVREIAEILLRRSTTDHDYLGVGEQMEDLVTIEEVDVDDEKGWDNAQRAIFYAMRTAIVEVSWPDGE